ncbi:hypothetical protein PHIM7_8 [Sinorhizobium phage phiM7]|uniref:Uncharacterized protein n=2 Tax=Emdodecavirus TaxID=1980937 RepID=A0A0R8U5T9_9CAUD|nr:hypothetical protein AVT40_gp019 [Sinorhizobium phage phiN3]YP_009601133.1 hypothetical protein FDH46_gp008 [Sinorhizobium phage phiM7]AKF12556.1 hypothetical protein PHIM7_8 [Sinorhizobium phage phiM7]AKF12916.1 hypothetical protein PHIM19_9 [Sinorhizobium phage phiM19]AKZ65591.1 hypothetical protein PHIN3_19 [Sinorhizobium phage phiN3]
MQLYDIQGGKIVERTTGFVVVSKISAKRAKSTLQKLNHENAGFQGFTPEFFTKNVKIGMR